MRTARKASHGQIESRGAELPFVVTVRREIQKLMIVGSVLQHVSGGPVDFGIASPAPFIVKFAAITETGEHQPVADARDLLFVQRQPGDGSDGSGNEQEPVGVSARK